MQLELLSKSRQALQQRFDEIVAEALTAYNDKPIIKVVASYSGGSDSAVVLELACHSRAIKQLDVMTIDTGLSTDNHIQRIKKEVNGLGLKLDICSNNGKEWYRQQVSDNGFAYTPNIHIIYYRMLKERALQAYIRKHKTQRFDQIAFLTGVRRLESVKRSRTPLYDKSGARLFINAIAEFNEHDKQTILNTQTWFNGKTTEDCMCNWHCKYTVDDLKDSPKLHKFISNLNDEMKSVGLWGYGEKPSSDLVQLEPEPEQEMPSNSLCINCYTKELL